MSIRLHHLLAFALAACSDDRAAGRPVVDETTNGVQARLSLPDGSPAVGARIDIAPSWHLEGLDDAIVRTRSTDSAGLWDASDLAAGDYVAEVRFGALGLRERLVVGPADSRRLEWTVSPFSTIRGSTLPGAILRAYGSSRIWRADSLGAFSLDSMPSGTWSLRADASTDHGDSLLGEGAVVAAPGDTLRAASPTGIDLDPSTWNQVASSILPPDPYGADSLAGVDVPLRLAASNLPSDPRGLRVVDPRGIDLAFAVDEWDPAGGTGILWARAAALHPRRGDTLRIVWGKPGVPAAIPPRKTDSVHGVWHFAGGSPYDEASGSGPRVASDSGTTSGVGILGGAREFHGLEFLSIPAPPDSALRRAFTVSCWILAQGAQRPWAKVLDLGGANAPFGTILFDIDSATGRPAFQMAFSDSSRKRIVATSPLSGWTRLTATWNGAEAALFVDGVLQGSFRSDLAPLPATGHDLVVGNQEGGADGFAGRIDELRFDLVARPVELIRHDAFLQRPPPP